MRLRELEANRRASRVSLALALALLAAVGLAAALTYVNVGRVDNDLERRTTGAVSALLDKRRADLAVRLIDAASRGTTAVEPLPADAARLRLAPDGRVLSREPMEPDLAYGGQDALGAILSQQVREAAAGGATDRVFTGFLSIEGGVSLVGGARISTGPAADDWLAAIQPLDDRALAEIAEAAGLERLILSPAQASTGSGVRLASLDGRPTAVVDIAPSVDPALNARRWLLAIVLLLAAALALALLIVHRELAHVGRRIAAREVETRRMASYDVVTGVANRMAFMEELAVRLAAGLTSKPFAVALVDLDHFKAVNDTFGHPVGDALLAEVGRRLAVIAPPGALVARLGGDEFGVIAPGLVGEDAALDFGRSICEAVAQPVHLGGADLHIGASVGLARAPFDGVGRSYLMRCADVALYASKADGRGRAELFTLAMETERRHKNYLARQVHAALLLDEFALVYQPIFATEGREVRGVEALLRWNHSFRGPVSPAEFIPIAEESDLIVRIGAWALRRALTDAYAWPDVYLSVNVSPVELARSDYASGLVDLLRETGFPAERLILEVTEGKLLSGAETMLNALAGLRSLGVRIAIDDFGTGWSSLGYLTRFRFDRIKIDRSFITGAAQRPEQALIVRAVAGLARGLDIAVIAEGVETDEDDAFVRAAGIGEAQGFGLARPMSAAAFGALLADARSDAARRAA